MSASHKMQNAPEIAITVGTRVKARPRGMTGANPYYYSGTGTLIETCTDAMYPYTVVLDNHHGSFAFTRDELQVLCSDNTDAETALDQIYTVLTDNSITNATALDKIATIIENTGRN